eukprot:Rhum_TRINITY_DN3234_c1_g1::Rhum_TRINITY_DN3234_c1_g1_i1::g.9967::m.9967
MAVAEAGEVDDGNLLVRLQQARQTLVRGGRDEEDSGELRHLVGCVLQLLSEQQKLVQARFDDGRVAACDRGPQPHHLVLVRHEAARPRRLDDQLQVRVDHKQRCAHLRVGPLGADGGAQHLHRRDDDALLGAHAHLEQRGDERPQQIRGGRQLVVRRDGHRRLQKVQHCRREGRVRRRLHAAQSRDAQGVHLVQDAPEAFGEGQERAVRRTRRLRLRHEVRGLLDEVRHDARRKRAHAVRGVSQQHGSEGAFGGVAVGARQHRQHQLLHGVLLLREAVLEQRVERGQRVVARVLGVAAAVCAQRVQHLRDHLRRQRLLLPRQRDAQALQQPRRVLLRARLKQGAHRRDEPQAVRRLPLRHRRQPHGDAHLRQPCVHLLQRLLQEGVAAQVAHVLKDGAAAAGTADTAGAAPGLAAAPTCPVGGGGAAGGPVAAVALRAATAAAAAAAATLSPAAVRLLLRRCRGRRERGRHAEGQVDVREGGERHGRDLGVRVPEARGLDPVPVHGVARLCEARAHSAPFNEVQIL